MRATGMNSVTPLRALRQRRRRHGVVAPSVIRDGAERVGVAAARQADLPECCGKNRAHPDRLLAMFGALQRVRDHDQRAAAVKFSRERHDGVGRNTGDGGGPCRVLGLAVGLAQHVALEHRPADRIAIEESAIVQPFDDQRVHQRQHQGDIGAGDVADPLRAGFIRQIAAQRADMHELAAARRGARHRAALDMLAGAAAGHHAVLQRHATEGEHDIAVLDDLLPGYVALGQFLVVADDVRHHDGGGTRTIGVDRFDVAAHRDVQEAMDLALRVVKAAGARPAIGAAEHRARTEIVAHAGEFGAEQVQRVLPGHRNELVAAAARVRPALSFEPAAAHHRLRDARAMPQGARKIVDDLVRIGIAGMRTNLEFIALPARRKHAPMGGMGAEGCVGCGSGLGRCRSHRSFAVSQALWIGWLWDSAV